MERLSHGLWTCKCGHREAEKPGEEETARVETDENKVAEMRTGFWEDRKETARKRMFRSHRKKVMDKKKKKTSTRG
jgi:hypothetical protein